MPVDIAPQVTPTYDAVINAPLDGEYANAAALQALVLPVANRVEFLNQGLIDSPFQSPFIKEDWFSVLKVGTAIHGDCGPWVYSESAAAFSDPVQATNGLVSGTAGLSRWSNASGTAAVIQIRKPCLITRTHVRKVSFRMQMFSTTANKALQMGMFDVGGGTTIGSGDTSGFGVIFDPAVHANFRTVGVTGGVYTYTDTGIPPVAGFHYQFDIDQDPDTLVCTLNISGAGAYAFAGMPLAGAALCPTVRMGSSDSGSREFNWDLYYLALSVSRY
jgi:hypothetical protein